MAYYPRVFYENGDEGGGGGGSAAADAALALGRTPEEIAALTKAYEDQKKAEEEIRAAREVGNQELVRYLEEQNRLARESSTISQEQLDQLQERIDRTEQLAEAEREANEEIEEAARLELELLGYANQVVDAVKKQVVELQNTRKALGQSTGLFGQFNQQLTDSVATAARFGKDQGVVSAAIGQLSNNMMNFTQMSNASQKTLIDGSIALGQFGVDAVTAAKNNDFLMNSLGKSAEEAVDYQKGLIELGSEIGMSGTMLVEQFGSMSKDLAKFGDNAGKVFENLARTAKETGVEMNELMGIAKQFDTFEGAASAVGKLNAQMGTNLDAMALLQEEDPAKQVEMLRDAFTATGKSIENMTKFEKMAAAEAMGMDVDVLQKFLGPKEEISETDKDFDELMEATMTFTDKLSAIGKQLATFFTPVMSALADLLDFISPVLSALGDVIQYLAENKKVAYSLATVIGLALAPQLIAMGKNFLVGAFGAIKFTASLVKQTVVLAYNNVVAGIAIARTYAGIAAQGIYNAVLMLGNVQYIASAIAHGVFTAAITLGTIAMNIATAATTALSIAMAVLTSPIGLVVLAVVGLIAIIYTFRESIAEVGAFFGALWDGIAEKFNYLIDAIVTGAEKASNSVSALLGSDDEEVPQLAEGTPNFKGGKAIVGEKGPEMVNLPRGAEVIPNNKLQAAQNNVTAANTAAEGRPPVIKLMLDERELGQAVLDVIDKKLSVFTGIN